MIERRKNPIDRCPERTKDEIAHASVKRMIERLLKHTKEEK